jgi:hypothetical protein
VQQGVWRSSKEKGWREEVSCGRSIYRSEVRG